jgi:hypothetical protein
MLVVGEFLGLILLQASEAATMSPLAATDTKSVRGAVLRRDPAREPCFQLVHLHQDMQDYGDMTPVSRQQRLHQHMHEMQSQDRRAVPC